MSPTIRIDDDVYDGLKKRAEPFVDTPNSVLRSLLGLGSPNGAFKEPDGASESQSSSPSPSKRPGAKSPQRATRTTKNKAVAKRPRVPAGSVLPEEQYELPLLRALVQFDGSATSRNVIDRVGELVEARLTDLDKDRLTSGGIRWQSRVQFVRLRLVQQGLMVKDAGKGIWTISEEGRKHLETHDRPGAA